MFQSLVQAALKVFRDVKADLCSRLLFRRRAYFGDERLYLFKVFREVQNAKSLFELEISVAHEADSDNEVGMRAFYAVDYSAQSIF